MPIWNFVEYSGNCSKTSTISRSESFKYQIQGKTTGRTPNAGNTGTLSADKKVVQQIHFTGNIGRAGNATLFFFII